MYAQPKEIEAEFKALNFTSSSSITLNQVTDWIKQESAYIDGIISLKYVTPVTETYENAFLILKRICIYRVCERVKNKLEVKSANNQTDQEVKSDNYTRTPNADLDRIASSKLLLQGVPLINSNGSASSQCETAECDTTSCHVFDESKQQW